MNDETKQIIDVIMDVGRMLSDKIEKLAVMTEDITEIKLKNNVVETTLIPYSYDISLLKKAQ